MDSERPRSEYDTPQWRALARAIKQRDGERCTQCGDLGPLLDVHHIHPVAEGGAMWDAHNLRTLCRPCHIAQHPSWAARLEAVNSQQAGSQESAAHLRNTPSVRTDETKLATIGGHPVASFGRRFSAWIIDMVIVSLITGFGGYIVWYLYASYASVDQILDLDGSVYHIRLDGTVDIAGNAILYLGLVISAVYVLTCWQLWGATIGKKMFSLVIIGKSGERMSGRQMFVRLLGYGLRCIPIALIIEGIVVIWERDCFRTFPDIIAGTYTVKRGHALQRQST